jgi:hypothetical protein
MATATKTTTTMPALDAAFDQVKDLIHRFAEAAREVGVLYIDAYETGVGQATELETKLANATQQEWLESLICTHVKFVREVADNYAGTARILLT